MDQGMGSALTLAPASRGLEHSPVSSKQTWGSTQCFGSMPTLWADGAQLEQSMDSALPLPTEGCQSCCEQTWDSTPCLRESITKPLTASWERAKRWDTVRVM